LYSLDSDNTDTRQGAGTSNVIPFKHPAAPIVKPRRPLVLRPKPVLCLDPAKLRRPPPKVSRALRAVPKTKWVTYDRFCRHRLRLPYGRRITEDGTTVLFNHKYDPLFVWRPGSCKPERYGPGLSYDRGVEEGLFFSLDSSDVIGRTKLWHALETILDAWERGDRAAAAAVEKWLLGKHRVFLELSRAYREDLAQYRAERELLEDILNGPRSPAKPA
jgi:hypothetical protein